MNVSLKEQVQDSEINKTNPQDEHKDQLRSTMRKRRNAQADRFT